MQKYSNNVQDQFGNELTGATITVRNNVGGGLSGIFSDDGVTPKANPFVAATSEFFFYAANGRYDIFITGTVVDEDLDNLLFDDTGLVGVQGLPSVLAIDPLTILDAEFALGASVIFSNGALNANFSMGATNFATVFAGGVANWDLSGIARLRMSGSSVAIALQEIAAAGADVATYGQYWVRSSDGSPMFTDDVGADFVLNGAVTLQDATDAGNTSDNDIELITGAAVTWFDAADSDSVTSEINSTTMAPAEAMVFLATANIEVYSFDEGINIDGGDFYAGSAGALNFYRYGDAVSSSLGPSGGDIRLQVVGGTSTFRVQADSIRLSEAATPAPDVASYGQFWVQSEGDNVPMFTSDAGTEQLIDPSRSDINEQNGNYGLVLADKGKTIRKASGGAGETYTIPANGSVAYKIGTLIAIRNDGGGDLSVAITTDTLTPTSGAAGTQTLGDAQTAIIQKIAATEWSYAASDI